MAKPKKPVLITTTEQVQGRPVEAYLGLAAGQALVGAHAVRDALANLKEVFSGRSHTYERMMERARDHALEDLEQAARDVGADAVIGLTIAYSAVGPHGGMLMVSVTGTAVRLAEAATVATAGERPPAIAHG